MSTVPAIKLMTVEEYLEMEDASEEKHEYYGGEVYAMAGASLAHNRIVRNALSSIDNFLRGKACEVFPSDLKVQVKTKSFFVYPDLSIVCNGLQRLEGRKDIITNPAVIIEVLSPDTQNFDHGEKFMLYRQIPSFTEYILISSMEVLIEKFVKQSSGIWTLTEFRNPEDIISINTIQFQTSVKELYRDVEFEEPIGRGYRIKRET